MAQETFIIVEAYMEVHIHFQSLVIDIFDTTSFSPQAITEVDLEPSQIFVMGVFCENS